MWGSNAREAHPIFFHHVLKGIRNGAKMYAVDPRRSTTAQWADAWLGIEVGSDISLANGIARADRAQICWTLGITEHHNAADNVFALINLALLTGHVGQYGSGLVPLRGQNNVQGGGDMGAIPNKLTGFQDIKTNVEARARFEAVYGAPIPPEPGMHLSLMFEAMERGELTSCYIIGENPLRSEADTGRVLGRVEADGHHHDLPLPRRGRQPRPARTGQPDREGDLPARQRHRLRSPVRERPVRFRVRPAPGP